MTVPEVAAVVIGRNEGRRLSPCFAALREQVNTIVYVDSGSKDNSVAIARGFSIFVSELDHAAPFTAARARNAGFDCLIQQSGCPSFVQFVDGDCEIQPNWIAIGAKFLQDHPAVAVVFGTCQERFPDASPYNRLCDIEWDTPIGEAASCGGNALMRTEAFRDAGGFDSQLIAGEEPDLCFRLRRKGWKILRIDAGMVVHDAGMTKFSQWWQRSRRSGYADMEASRRRGRDEPFLSAKVRSNFFWGQPLAWPLWPLLWLRVRRLRGPLYATHIVAGKLPHMLGQLSYCYSRLRRRSGRLIEYK